MSTSDHLKTNSKIPILNRKVLANTLKSKKGPKNKQDAGKNTEKENQNLQQSSELQSQQKSPKKNDELLVTFFDKSFVPDESKTEAKATINKNLE